MRGYSNLYWLRIGDYRVICWILLKFVEEDAAAPDEIEAIREARQEIERGELYSHEDVWA